MESAGLLVAMVGCSCFAVTVPCWGLPLLVKDSTSPCTAPRSLLLVIAKIYEYRPAGPLSQMQLFCHGCALLGLPGACQGLQPMHSIPYLTCRCFVWDSGEWSALGCC